MKTTISQAVKCIFCLAINVIMFGTVYGQVNYLGDWLQISNDIKVFSIKENSLAITPLNGKKSYLNPREFETQVKEESIIVYSSSVAIDTLKLISFTPVKMVLFQSSIENLIELEREQILETDEVDKFLDNNLKLTILDHKSISPQYVIYNEPSYEQLVKHHWDGCNKAFSFEIEEHLFGTILKVYQEFDNKKEESQYLLKNISENELTGKSLFGDNELEIEKLNLDLEGFILNENDLIGNYQMKVEESVHPDKYEKPKFFHFKLSIQNARKFKLESTYSKKVEEGYWKLISISGFTILQLTSKDSNDKETWLIEAKDDKQITFSVFNCDLSDRKPIVYDIVK